MSTPPDPNWRRIVGELLDHAFDVMPSLLLFAVAVGTRRLDVEFAAPLAFARPGGAKPIKPAKPARPPKGPRRPLGTPPSSGRGADHG